MKSMIEEIYDREIKGHSLKSNEIEAKLLETEQEIIKQYPECKNMFEEYLKYYAEYENHLAYEQFLNGFKTGAQLIIEIFSTIE